MANTIDTMSPEAILRGIIDGSLTEFEDEQTTSIGDSKFRYHESIRKVSLPRLLTFNAGIAGGVFLHASSLETVYLPMFQGPIHDDFFAETKIKVIALPSATGIGRGGISGNTIETVDIGPKATSLGAYGQPGLKGNMSSLTTVILRNPSSVVSVGYRLPSGTPFSNGGGYYTPRYPLSKTTRLRRTGRHGTASAISSFRSKNQSSSIITRTVLPSHKREGVMVYG